METSNECFVKALQQSLMKQGRGAKKKLAEKVDISPNHLSDILASRKNAGQKLKEQIAQTLEISFEEMLALGRQLIKEPHVDADIGSVRQRNKGNHYLSTVPDNFMEMVNQILEHNLLYREALINNVLVYHQAIKTSEKEQKTFQMIHELQEDLRSLRADLEPLKHKNNNEEIPPKEAT